MSTGVRSGGVITTVDFPDVPHTYAIGINDAGAFVGYFYSDASSSQPNGFVALP